MLNVGCVGCRADVVDNGSGEFMARGFHIIVFLMAVIVAVMVLNPLDQRHSQPRGIETRHTRQTAPQARQNQFTPPVILHLQQMPSIPMSGFALQAAGAFVLIRMYRQR